MPTSETKRKAVEADLAAKLASADKEIAARKAAAMANVSAIAQETAAAIVAQAHGPAGKRRRAFLGPLGGRQELKGQAMPHLFADPEFWVAVAFVIFLGLAAWLGAFKALVNGLDQRGARIAGELARGEAAARGGPGTPCLL